MRKETFLIDLGRELKTNSGKISLTFVEKYLNHSSTEIIHHQMTPSTRVCVIRLPMGHELVGYARVLDPKNDIEAMGQEVAYNNAAEQIWSVFGSIAKVI